MIEVLFGESEAGSMKVAKEKVVTNLSDGPVSFSVAGEKMEPGKDGWEKGTTDDVICLAFMLDIGDLTKDICSEYRKELICSMLNQGQWKENPETEAELKEAAGVYIGGLENLRKYLEAGEEIRIWYSRSAYSLCGLYCVCNLLCNNRNRVFLVELPDFLVKGDGIVSYQNWGELVPEDFALFIDNQKEIDSHGKKLYAARWEGLIEDKSLLRAVINNQVVGVEDSFYDFLIWKKLTDKPVKQARLIGSILRDNEISVSDWWYAKRIQYYIDKGSIEIVEDSESRYDRVIRKKV